MKTKVNSDSSKSKDYTKERFIPVKYNLHLGTIVREKLYEKGIKQNALANKLGVSPVAVQNKLNNPIFGSPYDIVETSLYINIDLFLLIRQALVNDGIDLFRGNEETLSEKIKSLQSDVELLRKENDLLKKLVEISKPAKK
jgi:transcriptional regulator with XRE-family HTH domain